MKVKSLTGLIAVILCIITASCTQNNGHIGKYFGAWTLRSLTVDGTEESFMPEGARYGTLSFQGAVVRFQVVYTADEISETYATWSDTDNELHFDFNNSNDETPSGTSIYAPPAWLGFSGMNVTVKVTRLDSSHLDFERTDAEGHLWRYAFERTW